MNTNTRNWKNLLYCCLGLFAGTAFCMKWMEGEFRQNDQLFTIIGLEISYPKEKVIAILSGLDNHVRTILRYHLSFDFAFMAGVYPGIVAMCMLARNKFQGVAIRNLLMILALLQLLAWGCDIVENICLLKWIKEPVIESGFSTYHFIVAVKWITALAGALIAIPLLLIKRKSV